MKSDSATAPIGHGPDKDNARLASFIQNVGEVNPGNAHLLGRFRAVNFQQIHVSFKFHATSINRILRECQHLFWREML